jgi:hypothetical protein
MAEAFQHISIHAVRVLARVAAKRAIEAELKAKGVRTSLVRPAELKALADIYFSQHQEELVELGKERARLMGLFEKQSKGSKPRMPFLAK